MNESNVTLLKKLGTEIIEAKYETSLSSYTYPPEELNARAAVSIEFWFIFFSFLVVMNLLYNNYSPTQEIDQDWEALAELATHKKNELETNLSRETEKERLRLEFASQAQAFLAYVKDTSETLASTLFGDDLDQVEVGIYICLSFFIFQCLKEFHKDFHSIIFCCFYSNFFRYLSVYLFIYLFIYYFSM